jgi:pimeloyl-ACP methyl ester carboxylesterase
MRTGGRVFLGVVVAMLVGACGQVAPTAAPAEPTHLPSQLPTLTASPAASPSAAPSAQPSPALPGPSATPLAGGWSFVGKEACPDSEFECTTLSVPRDHFTAGGPTWDVTFAMHRATGKRVGTYVVITGGPGSSGVASADSYTGYFPASIPEHFDIVFLDQRGVGMSKPLACPSATAAYYATDVPDGVAATDAAAGVAAKTYVTDCLAETHVEVADLPFYSTRQAVEDLEAIRAYLGAPRIHLYGESYGTQYVQTYAAAHPDRIAALYLDGPVDLTIDGATFLGESTRTFNDTFIATVNACRADPACAADLGGVDPLAAYDALVARARAGALALDFPMGDGTTQHRVLTAADVQVAAEDYLYGIGDRALLLRALTAAYRGDLVPLARIAYASLALNPDTLKVVPDPTYSDAMYYAVECQDYVYNAGAGSGSDADRLAAFLAEGRANGAERARFGAVYYDDMPCLFWPGQPATDPRPAAIVDAPYPTVVLVATTDPITPVENAIRIANRLRNVHVIIQTGGPHVIFGWGLPCPDNLVADYMVLGKSLGGPVVTCPGSVADPYVALAKTAAADYRTAAAFMGSFADQVLNTNDYVDMLDKDPIAMGCDLGGVLSYRPAASGTGLVLAGCAFTTGMAVSGTGSIDADGGISLRVTLPDGALTYARDAAGKVTISGTFRGLAVKGGG